MDIELPVTVTYTEGAHSRSTIFTLTVDKLLSMDVSLLPTKTQYQVGEEIDYSGISFIVTSTLGSPRTIGKNDVVFDISEGTKVYENSSSSITATYTDEYKVTVSASFELEINKLQSLDIAQKPTKTKYSAGDVFDYSGIEILSKTAFGDTESIPITDVVFDPPEGSSVDSFMDSTVTATYTNSSGIVVTASFDVEIEKIKLLGYIQDSLGIQTIGEPIDYTGARFQAVYTNGRMKNISFGDSGLSFTLPQGTIINEDTEVTVTYVDENGLTASQMITAKVDRADSMRHLFGSFGFFYQPGEKLDFSKADITVIYLSGKVVHPRYDDPRLTFSHPHGTTITDDIDLEVTYTDEYGFTLNIRAQILVNRITGFWGYSRDRESIFEIGSPLSYNRLLFEVHYKSGAFIYVDYDDPKLSFSPPAGTIINDDLDVTVTYDNVISTTVPFKVIKVRGIEFSSNDDIYKPKRVYNIGEALNLTGFRAHILYTDKYKQVAYNYPRISYNPPHGTIINDDTSITVTYTDEHGFVANTTTAVQIQRVRYLSWAPNAWFKQLYTSGEALDLIGIDLIAHYTTTRQELSRTDPRLSFSPPEGTILTNETSVIATFTDENGYTANFDIPIIVETLKNLIPVRLKRAYVSGDALSYEDSCFRAVYTTGKTVDVEYCDSRLTITPPEGTIITGDTDITVNYTDGRGDSVSLTALACIDAVNCLEPVAGTLKFSYSKGSVLDFSGAKFKAGYSNGESHIVSYGDSNLSFSPESRTTITKDTAILVTYTDRKGISANLIINIQAK